MEPHHLGDRVSPLDGSKKDQPVSRNQDGGDVISDRTLQNNSFPQTRGGEKTIFATKPGPVKLVWCQIREEPVSTGSSR